MPTICAYTPSEGSKKHFKNLCGHLVEFIKHIERDGVPDCCTLKQAHELIDHLYEPSDCEEKK